MDYQYLRLHMGDKCPIGKVLGVHCGNCPHAGTTWENNRKGLDKFTIKCWYKAPAQDDANQVEKDAEGFRKYLGR